MAAYLEKVIQVWDDKVGDRYEFGPDSDGLDAFIIRYFDSNGNVTERITIDSEKAKLLFTEALKLINGE